MATAATYKKRQQIAARQRLSVSNIEDISTLGLENQAEDFFASQVADDCVLGGLEIAWTSGRTFQVNAGALVARGEIVKLPTGSVSLGEQDAIVLGTDDRIDVVYVDPADPWTEASSDSATNTYLNTTSTGTASAYAVGTGDGVTKLWPLGHAQADFGTLIVQVAGSVEHGGIDFSKGTGGAGVDQIVFADAPGVGDAIVADYDYLVGGVESSGSVSTRYTRVPKFLVSKGPEAVSPGITAPPAGSIEIGRIQYGVGWTTGDPLTADGSYDYDNKTFAYARDSVNENSYGATYSGTETTDHSPFDQVARASDMLRNMGQVRHGCRLRYSSSDTVKIGPGWINSHGLSCRVKEDITFTLQSTTPATVATYVTGGAQWVYIYANPAAPSAGSGGPFTCHVGSVPNSLGQDTQNPATYTGSFYLGAVYVTATGPPVIREFSSDDDGWVWWNSSASALAVGSSPASINVSAWTPPTGKKISVSVTATFVATAINEHAKVEVGSNSNGSSLGNLPDITINMNSVASGTFADIKTGILRVEDNAGTMEIYGDETLTSGTSITGTVDVQGYYDSIYCVDTDGTSITH